MKASWKWFHSGWRAHRAYHEGHEALDDPGLVALADLGLQHSEQRLGSRAFPRRLGVLVKVVDEGVKGYLGRGGQLIRPAGVVASEDGGNLKTEPVLVICLAAYFAGAGVCDVFHLLDKLDLSQRDIVDLVFVTDESK